MARPRSETPKEHISIIRAKKKTAGHMFSELSVSMTRK